MKTLYADGGIPRFYRGVLPALIQGPLSRFGDTAANTGMITLMNSMESTKDLNVGLKTISASAAAAAFRIFLMPVVSIYFQTYVYLMFTSLLSDISKMTCLSQTNATQYDRILSRLQCKLLVNSLMLLTK